MKAIVYTEYGSPDVLKLKEIDKPVPKDNEVLIKIHATTVTTADVNARGFVFVFPGFKLLSRLAFGVRGPRNQILGFELAGEVEEVGTEVTSFLEGDQVFGATGGGFGAYAEYISLPEEGLLATKPTNMTYEEAASVFFGGHTALHFLRDKGNVRTGQKVLINGASGGVGTAAVQIAKYYGAEVTGVSSTGNLEMVKSLGADKVIDYTKEDFTKSGETYDAILDMVGNVSFSRSKSALTDKGILLAGTGGPLPIFQMLWTSIIGSKKVVAGPATERKEDVAFLKELVEAGNFKTVIDRRFPFEQAAEAHRYVDSGHKKGNVVITVEHNSETE